MAKTIRLLVFSAVALLIASSSLHADSLDQLRLPPVAQVPWQFQEFPIAAWWGPPGTATREDFQNYKDAGFNLHATNLDTGFDQALIFIENVGLHSLTLRTPGNFELPPRANPVPPSNRPAIVGWIVDDEPNGDVAVSNSIRQVNALMRNDPSRWAFFNLLPPNLQADSGTAGVVAAATRNGMPVVSFDDYPIMVDGSDLTTRFYTNLSTVRRAALQAGRHFWAFGVTIEHNGYAGRYRRPSESDLRWMQFSNLAYGAKGLWYFTYWGASTLPGFSHTAIVGNDGTQSELYEMVRAINTTVQAAGQTLLRLQSTSVVHTLPPQGQPAFVPHSTWIDSVAGRDVLIGFFKDLAGVDYALLVNKVHGASLSAQAASDAIALKFDSSVRSVEAVSWLDGATGPLTLDQTRSATMHLAGGTGVLLRMTR